MVGGFEVSFRMIEEQTITMHSPTCSVVFLIRKTNFDQSFVENVLTFGNFCCFLFVVRLTRRVWNARNGMPDLGTR